MILQALNKLCEREGLLGDDSNYELKPITWMVRVGNDGNFLGMIDNRKQVIIPAKTKKGKPKTDYHARYRWVPREPERTSGDYAFFLCDNSEYIFGLEAPAKKGAKRPKNKLENRNKLFREKISECLDETGDPAIEALLVMLNHARKNPSDITLDPVCDASDLITFVFAPDIDLTMCDRPAIREYWANKRSSEIQKQPLVKCLVTQETTRRLPKHNLIKNVPGGTPSGVALVSFNNNAFESYDLHGNDNAPIGHMASLKCSTALNRLLNRNAPDPTNPDSALPSRHCRLSADTVVCYWTVSDAAEDFCDMFSGLMEANPEEVGQVYRSIWSGKAPPDLDADAFYALTLTGTQGRTVVRDWIESTVATVAKNVSQYFADLRIARNCPPPKKGGHPPAFALRPLLESIADPVKRRGEGVPGPIAAQIAHAALSNLALPRTALIRAINRYRMELGNEHDDDGGWFARNWNDHRAALIRASLIRLKRHGQIRLNEEIQPTMNPASQHDGYVLGQLMAVFERLQQLALDNPNASVVDRYFSGASAAPKSVFVRLYKNARHHARKTRDDKKNAGSAFLLERMIDSLSARFGVLDPESPDYKKQLAQPHTLGFPAHLSIEEQGLFVLGYHQTRHWLWLSKEERRVWEDEQPDAPKAFLWTKRKEEAEAATGEAVEL